MVEKYRIQHSDSSETAFSIRFAHKREDYVDGDFYVRAIKGSTDVDKHIRKHFYRKLYTDPMTVEEARTFIEQNRDMIEEVHDCMGLILDDEDGYVVIDFDEKILIRNM